MLAGSFPQSLARVSSITPHFGKVSDRPFLLQVLRRPLTRLRCSDGQAEKNCIKSSSEASLWPTYTSYMSTNNYQ